ncbi:MAG TPA: hypothetical protein EYP82_04850, partial [Hydrogenothermaceae bacterium]|nr:hypothetical protein [Hydrogenothermaceae bacterium]
LLVGIALSFFYSASLMILFYLSDESQSFEIIRFTMGSVDVVGIEESIPLILSGLGLLAISLWYQKDQNYCTHTLSKGLHKLQTLQLTQLEKKV